MDELLKQLNDINEDLEDDAFEAPTNEEMPVENVDLSVRAQEKKITWTLKKNDAVRFHKILEFINSNPNVHFMLAGDGTERKDALTRLNQLGPDERIKIAINYRNPQGLNNKCFYFLDMIVGPLLFGDDKGSKLNPVLPTDPELRVIRNFLMDLKLPHAELVFETLDRLYEDFDDDCFETSEPYIPLVEIIYDYPNIVGCEIKNSKGKKGTIEKQSNSQLWVHWEGNKNYSTINISYPDRLGGYMIRKHRINEDTEDTNDMFDAAELPNENAGKEGSSEHMAKIKKLLEDKGWEVQHMATLYPKRDCVEWYDVGTRLFDLKRGNIIFHFYVSGNGLHITLPNGEDDVSDMTELLRYGVYDDETFASWCDELYKEVEGPFDESDVSIDFWMENEDTEEDLGSSYDYDYPSNSSISGVLEDILLNDETLADIGVMIDEFNDNDTLEEARDSGFESSSPKFEFNKYGIEVSDPKTKKKLMGCTDIDISNVSTEYPLRIFASMPNVIIYVNKNEDWSNDAIIKDLEEAADILGFPSWGDFVKVCLRVDEDLDTNEEGFDISETNGALRYILDYGHVIPQEVKQMMVDNYSSWDETPVGVKWTVVKDAPVLHTEEAGALLAPSGKFEDNDYIIYYGDNYDGSDCGFECEYIWNDYARDMIGPDAYNKELREDVEEGAFETNDRSIDLDDLTDEQKDYIINNFIDIVHNSTIYGSYIHNTEQPWRIKPYAAARNGFDYRVIVKGIIPIVPLIISEDQLHELVNAVGNVNISEELEDGFEDSDWVAPGRVLSKDEVGSDYGYYELSSEQCYILDARTSGGSHDLPDDTWGEMFRRGNDIWVDLFSLSSPEEFMGTLNDITDEDLAAIHVNKEEIPDLVLEEDFEPFSDEDIDVKRVGQSKLSLYIKGKLVSWVYVSDTGYIYYLETKKEYRGLGLGTILIKQAIAEMGGYWLHIERPNIKVQRWYENLGFTFYNPDDKYVRLMVKEDRIPDFEELTKKCGGNLRKMLGNLADKVIVDLNDYENKPEVRTVYDDEGNILKEMIKEDFMDDMDIFEPSNAPDILRICSTDTMFHTKGGMIVSLNPEKVRGALIELLKTQGYSQPDIEDSVDSIDRCVFMLDDINSSTDGSDNLIFSSETDSHNSNLPRMLTVEFFDKVKIDPAGFFHGDWFERIRNGEDGEDILAEKYPDVVLRYRDRFNDTVNESKEDRARFSKWANDPKLEKDFYDNQQRLTDKDIYSWMKKTPADLRQAIDDLDDTNAEKRAEAMKGATLVTRGDYWTIYRIDTVEASKLLGKGTKWCISGTGSMEIELPVYASSKARAMVSIRKSFPKAEITSVTADDDGMYLVGIKTTQGDFYFNDYKENEEATYYFLISTPANKECYGDIKMNKVAIKITSFNDINIYNSQDTEISVDDIPHNDDLFDYQILK